MPCHSLHYMKSTGSLNQSIYLFRHYVKAHSDSEKSKKQGDKSSVMVRLNYKK